MILRDAALFTDLYELTMAASYARERMQDEATFSLFVRRLPAHRSFLIAAGLEDALAFLESFAFSEAALAYLRSIFCVTARLTSAAVTSVWPSRSAQ